MTQLSTIGDKKQGKIARQDLFIQSYRHNLFNITRARLEIGINRKSYYRWLDNDDTGFAKKLEAARYQMSITLSGLRQLSWPAVTLSMGQGNLMHGII